MRRNSPGLLILTVSAISLSGMAGALAQTVMPPGPPPGAASVDDMSITELEFAATQAREARNYPAAIRVLSTILSRDESNKEALAMLGDIYWEIGDPGKARLYWLEVLKIHSTDFGANFGLGRMHLNTGVFRSAAHYLAIAEKVAPAEKLVEVLVPLAQSYGKLGDFDKALDAVQRAIAISPDNFEAQYALTGISAIGATGEEDYDATDAEAQRLVELADRKLRTEGVTREGVQQKYSALDLRLSVLRRYQNVLFEINPDGSVSDKPLADRKKQLARVTSRVVETMLKQEDTRRTIAYFDVLQLAAKAVELSDGTDKSALTTLALLQERTGDVAGAIETFNRVVELDPNDATAAKALEQLQQQPAAESPQ